MIEGTQKVIKIGSSNGITISAKDLKNQGVSSGDEIRFMWEPVKNHNKVVKHKKLLSDLDSFMNTYDQDLKSLANR